MTERMQSERWQQVKEVLFAASELEAGKRAAFLDAACKGDPELRREVEELLVSHDRAGGFFERPLLDGVAEMVAEDKDRAMAGKTLGHYKVLSLLGAGGMGDVYLAEDALLGRKVALKLLPPHYTRDQNRLHRLKQEARAASAFNHPNILTIHEIGDVDGLHFIATEFIEGETLGQRMKTGEMNVGDALDVAVQVANALATAHAAGIVHRDIKPDNIMVRTDGIVKVLDFGIAKLTEPWNNDFNESLGKISQLPAHPMKPGEIHPEIPVPADTIAGVVIGTARYMSPEQARGQDIDARTDIWSLGVVLYEMVAGRPPYEGKTVRETVSSILECAPVRLKRHAPQAPVELEQILRKCLEKDRKHRYQSAQELLDDLKDLRRRIEIGVARETGGGWRTLFKTRYAPAAAGFWVMLIGAALFYAWLSRGAPATPVPKIKSLAVLPLENRSRDSAQDLFTDGMTEALIDNLAKIGALRVIAHTSVMRYKGKQTSLPQIARELNVDAVVEGSVLRSGEQVRLAARLIHVSTGTQLWADSYERHVHNIENLQQEAARDIAAEVRIALTPQEHKRLTDARPVNAEALEAYLKGRSCLDERNEEALKTAITYFNEAVEKDPGYALAQVALSDAYFALGTVNVGALSPAEALDKGGAAALKAIQLDDSLAEAHTALGVIKLYSWKWSEAEREFNNAIELNPNYAPAHSWYAIYLTAQGRLGEAIARIYRAREIDPLSPHISQNVGWILHYARQYDEEVEQYRRALDLDPNFLFARLRLAGVFLEKRLFSEAIGEYERAAGISNRSPSTLGGLGNVYAVAGRRSEARQILAELLALRKRRYVNPHCIDVIYLGLGDRDRALEWLEKSYRERSYATVFLKVDAQFDILRSDPRFQDILRRVGL